LIFDNLIVAGRKAGKAMELYLDTRKREITNEKGKIVHVDNAKVFWLDGKVDDCSLSFQRLANFDFDFDKLDKFYAECDR
jgi:hypothetical protein